jgi:hypothetical protein
MAKCNPALFEITRGDDFLFTLNFKDDDDIAVDITGAEYKCTMKKAITVLDVDASLSLDIPAVSGFEAEAGLLYVELPRAQTENLEPGLYFFDVQQKKDDKVLTIVNDRVKVKADVTQRV